MTTPTTTPTLDIEALIRQHEATVSARQAERAGKERAKRDAVEREFEHQVTAWLGPVAALLRWGEQRWATKTELVREFELEGKRGLIQRRHWGNPEDPLINARTLLVIGDQTLEMKRAAGEVVPLENAGYYDLPAFFAGFRAWKAQNDTDQRWHAHSRELHDVLQGTRDIAVINAALPDLLERYAEPPLKEKTLERAAERIEHLQREQEAEAERAASRARAEADRAQALADAAALWHPFLIYKVTYGATDRDSSGADMQAEFFYSLRANASDGGWWSKIEGGAKTRLRVFNVLAAEELHVLTPDSPLARAVCRVERRAGVSVVYPPDGAWRLP